MGVNKSFKKFLSNRVRTIDFELILTDFEGFNLSDTDTDTSTKINIFFKFGYVRNLHQKRRRIVKV